MNEKQISGDPVIVVEADLASAEHQEATVRLLNAYAMDPMGDGRPLSETARRDLIAGLRELPTTIVFLAYQGEPSGRAGDLLSRLFDLRRSPTAEHPRFFRRAGRPWHRHWPADSGGSRTAGRELGCCKLTLEVQENNRRAQGIYAAAGFLQAVHVPAAGAARFLTKPL